MKVYTNTPDDKSWLAMCFMMSKKESDDKGVNVKRGLKTKAEEGWFPGSWTKPGYMWDKMAERGNKTILKDPVRFPLIKKCWELMLTGAYTPPQILDKLNNEWGYRTPTRKTKGGNPMARSQIYRIFYDPYYCKTYEYPKRSGNWIIGSHDEMVTREEFDRVQILLGRKGSTRPQKKYFPFTGLIRCGECGAMITAEERWQCICANCKNKFSSTHSDTCTECGTKISEMKNPTLLHYIHYHCTKRRDPNCTQGVISPEELEKQIDVFLANIGISEDFKNWAIKYLNELNDSEMTVRNASLSSLQEAYNTCVKRLDNLLQLKISPQNADGSLLSDEEFKSQKTAIMAEKAGLEQKLSGTGQRINNWLENAEKAFDFAIHARYWFANGTPEEKRRILVAVGSNLVLKDGILHLDLQKPYCFLEEAVKTDFTTSQEFEPQEKGSTTTYLELSWSQNPAVLPRVDSDHEPTD